MAQVLLESISKTYPDGTSAVEDLSLCVADQEFLVLVGPSGCGKSTTLRLIAGLEKPTSGKISIGGKVVNDIAPKDRDIAMVFQNYALYPHMSVYRNLSFGLELRYGGGFVARVLRHWVDPRRAAELAGLRGGIDQQVRQAARRLNIDSLLDRKPHQLSGGERQRVALGRAIVRNPAAFLFDEPLSNLDAKLRQQMRSDLKRLHNSLSATMIYVTHDQIEAMTLGSRVAVMNHGRLQQLAEPQTVYRRPANRFVAKFFGSTPINLVNGQLHRTDDGWCFVKDDWKWSFTGSEPMTASESMARTTGLAGVAGFERADGSKKWPQKVTLGFRGEELQVSAIAAADNCIPFAKVRVLALDHWGDATIAHLEPPFEITKHLDSKSDLLDGKLEGHSADDSSDSPEWFAKLPNDTNIATGDSIKLSLAVDRCLWFDGETGKNLLQHK